MELRAELLAELQDLARREGLLRLGAVRLDHPGLADAADELDRFIADGRIGEMDYLARAARARRDPTLVLAGARSALVAVVPYAGEAGPVARYAQGADYHTVIHRRFEVVERVLKARLPGVETRVCVDTKPVLERTLAVLAGLGFLGKNGCVITPGLGSYVVLGELLCTASWTGGDAVADVGRLRWDACGSCTRCLDACPTNAFVAAGRLDPRRCIAYLTIEHRGSVAPDLADRMGERVAGCDVCQEVCPYNHGHQREYRTPAQAWLEPAPGEPRRFDPLALANIRSGRYRAFVRGTALSRIPRRALRRNALLALGNRRRALTADERAAVTLAEHDADPQVRAAAIRVVRRRS